jgi:lambda family phage minor tail protein L
MTSIADQLTKLEVSSKIELLVVDATVVGGGVYYLVNETNALSQPVVWQGQTYTPYPIMASGFEQRGDGPLPRPKLRVANVLGLLGVLTRDHSRLEGSKVVRKRTLAKYLDAVNFAGGVNPSADSTAHYPDDVWYIDRMSLRTKEQVEFELASPLDLAGVMLPRRQIQARACGWKYRSPECGYTGPPVADANDVALVPDSQGVVDSARDSCGHRVKSCELRFGKGNELPIGCFPGAGLLRNV